MSVELQQIDQIPGHKPSRKRSVKSRVLDEAKKFLGIFIYLAVVFGLFVLHEWVVLSSEHLTYRFYGFALINALILAKIMLIAEGLHFAEKFESRPLVFPIVYKALAFTILLMGAYVVEETGIAMLHGESAAQAIPKIGGGTIGGIAAVTMIVCVALIPFFAYRELSRVFGEAQLHALLFTRGAQADRSPAASCSAG
jgi:hypothetical protein